MHACIACWRAINKICGMYSAAATICPASCKRWLEQPSTAAWWPWPLTFDFLTLELVRNVSRGTDNLPANFGVSATFRCRVIGKHVSDWRYELIWPWPLNFDVTAHDGDASPHTPSLPKFVDLSFGRYFAFSVSTLIALENLTFDRRLNGVTVSPVSLASLLPIFSLLHSSILDLGSGTGQTDRRTDRRRRRPSTLSEAGT